MATIYDLGFANLIQLMSPILPFLLVSLITYAFLVYKQIITNKNIAGIIAFVMGLVVLITPGLNQVILIIIPWYAIGFVVILLIMAVYQFVGLKQYSQFGGSYQKYDIAIQDILRYGLSALFVGVLIAALAKVYFIDGLATQGQNVQEVIDSGEFSFWATVFHPNVIGFFVLMLIGAFTILLITGKQEI